MTETETDTAPDVSALFSAIAAGDGAAVRSLLRSDPALAAARNERGLSAVRAARYRSASEVLALLLDTHPELDVFDAATVGDVDRLRALLEADSTLATARSNDDATALHFAAFFDQPPAARLLIEHGADVAARAEPFGDVTPLHSAAAGNAIEVVEMLLAAGADPNAAQRGGWRSLHSAAQNGNAAMVRLLRAHGADPTLPNDEGRYATDLVRGSDADEVLAALS
jgi:uncharacterized protein